MSTSLPTAASQQRLLIQFGSLPLHAWVTTTETAQWKRGDWIVCETGRGLEVGRLVKLGQSQNQGAEESPTVAKFLRTATDGDLLAFSRLNSRKDAGLQACNDWLQSEGSTDVLLDADLTLDGQRIFFHFLGDFQEFDPDRDQRLAEIFNQAAGIQQFTDAVQQGCGPNCGSDGSGCNSSQGCGTNEKGSSGCASCGLKSSCKR